MMRALFSGVTGLRSHQTKMDVIGNNISNVNTLGYKKSTANFADIYSETVSPSSAPSGSNGGVNARQVGLGVQLTSIQIKHNPGAAQYTGNTLDIAIQGDGFLAVRTNGDGREAYTRAGNLSISSNGSLVTSAGNFVQCFQSTYKQGDAGVVSSTGFKGTDGQPKKATGFSSFDYEPDYASIVTTASGTYTIELAANNTSVIVMKNGIAIGEPIPIMEQPRAGQDGIVGQPQPLTTYTGFKPNTEYTIDLPDIGTIRFTTDGVRVSNNISGISVPGFKDGKFEQGITVNYATPDAPVKEVIDPTTLETYPKGQYKFSLFTDGDVTETSGIYTLNVTTPTENGPDGQPIQPGNAAQATLRVLDKTGTPRADAIGPGNPIPAGSTIVISTAFGDMEIGVSQDLSGDEALAKIEDMLKSLNVTLGAGPGQGAENITTGLASLNGLLTGASMSVSNNDEFLATATRGDMIINQDLFENISIGDDGAVVGQLKANTTGQTLATEAGIIGAQDMAAGEKVVLGYIALATFSNPEGLEKIGTNLYELTSNSGRAMYYTPGTGGTGAIASSSLEMSNVDLSEEMVNMITTQRGFQANSRIITTTDTMLEELINLKR